MALDQRITSTNNSRRFKRLLLNLTLTKDLPGTMENRRSTCEARRINEHLVAKDDRLVLRFSERNKKRFVRMRST
eukprot:1586375-Amphidinium_carterae.1